MVEESIVFSGDIDERSLDRSAQTVEERFSEAGEIEARIDERELQRSLPDNVSVGVSAEGGAGAGGGMSKLDLASLAVQERTLKWQKESAQEDALRNKMLQSAGKELTRIREQIPSLAQGGGRPGLPGDTVDVGGEGGTGPLELAGMDALRKKIPAPIAGVAASSVLPVALAGGVGAGIGASMMSASNRLQTSAGLLGQAWNSFWRPIGDRVDELFIRDVVKDVHTAMVGFEQTAREEGLFQASVELLIDESAVGDAEEDPLDFILGGIEDAFGGVTMTPDDVMGAFGVDVSLHPADVVDEVFGTDEEVDVSDELTFTEVSQSGLLDVLSFSEITESGLLGDMDFAEITESGLLGETTWKEITESGLLDDIDFKTITESGFLSSPTWEKITDDELLGQPTWETIKSSGFLDHMNMDEITGKEFVEGLPIQSITGDTFLEGIFTEDKITKEDIWDTILADLSEGNTGPDPGPGGPGVVVPTQGFQRGGVVQGRTNATLGEAGPEVVQPLSEFERVAERIARTAARQGGGRVDMGRVEGKLDAVKRSIDDLARAMSQFDFYVDSERIGRAATDGQRNAVSDTNPLT